MNLILRCSLLLVVSVSFSPLFAESVRVWTQKETGKEIRATLVGKSATHDQATLRMENGSVFLVKTEVLAEADQTYIRQWLNNEDKLTCIVVGKPFDGYKSVRVQAQAGPVDLKIVVDPPPYEPPKAQSLVPLVVEIKAGAAHDNTYTLPNKYQVTAYEGEKMVDMESHQKKTGRR